MSRHRNVKDEVNSFYEDDYYEDDYYDDEYYDDYKEKQSSINISDLVKTKKSKSKPKKSTSIVSNDNDDLKKSPIYPSSSLDFIFEALGFDKSKGTSPMGNHISEARILQMMHAYDNDPERVINFFMNDSKTPTKSMSDKPNLSPIEPLTRSIPRTNSDGALKNKESKSQNFTSNSPAKPPTVNKLPRSLSSSSFKSIDDINKINESPIKLVRAASGLSLRSASSGNLLNSSKARTLSDEDFSNNSASVNDELKLNDETSLPEITMVVVGHVDAGKSTLVGNLLYNNGNVQKRTLNKFEKDSMCIGKSSFYLAWVMDEDESEREHGVTIGIAERLLVTEKRRITILDAPGHRDFIPNMISGTTQADVALLVIPSTNGEYETSMKLDSQTREHAIILKALGVNQIVVVVNKMETCEWSNVRFEQIKAEVGKMLELLQYGPKAVRYIPTSGLSGENLVKLSQENPINRWYNGPTLLEAINDFRDPPRQYNKPFRAIITAVIKENKVGSDVSVKILQGKINKGRGVGIGSISSRNNHESSDVSGKVAPQFISDVKKINIDGEPCEFLMAGQNGILNLVDRNGLSGEEMCLRDGLVLYKGPPFLRPCKKFKATISTTSSLNLPIIAGSTFDLYLHGEEILCYIKKIYSANIPKKGNLIKPKCIPINSVAVVKIKMEKASFIEPFSDCTALGRFALRSRGITSAVGICTKTYEILL